MLIVSDTSPISNLIIIGQTGLLHEIYPEILMPPAVFQELSASRKFDISRELIPGRFEVKQISGHTLLESLLAELDAGEAEAIILAKELGAEVLLIDERKGRLKAKELGVPVMGIAGLLITAKSLGLISRIEPVLVDLEHKAGFWMGNNLKNHILKMAGE